MCVKRFSKKESVLFKAGITSLKSLIASSYMMTSSNGNIFCVTGPLCGEFPVQRPVTWSFDVFFDLRLNKQWYKQSWGWWFETLSGPLWRHCNDNILIVKLFCCSNVHGVVMVNLWYECRVSSLHLSTVNLSFVFFVRMGNTVNWIWICLLMSRRGLLWLLITRLLINSLRPSDTYKRQ